MYYTLIIQYKNEKDWCYVSERLNTTKRQDISLSNIDAKRCDLLYPSYAEAEGTAFKMLSGNAKDSIGYLKISSMNSYNMDKEKEVIKFWDKTK
jgi:hypothetical protein